MNWLLAIALVGAGTVATLSALAIIAILSLIIREGIVMAYRGITGQTNSAELESAS